MLGIVVRALIVSWIGVASYAIWQIEVEHPGLAVILACGLFVCVLAFVTIDTLLLERGDS